MDNVNWRTCAIHRDGNPNVWGCPECLRELRRENAALKKFLAGAGWQRIDSAPKDGTAILGRTAENVTVVQWFHPVGGDGYWTLTVPGAFAEDGEWWPTEWKAIE